MSSARKSIGNAAIYLAANAMHALIQFGMVPVLTRTMGPENFGLAALYLVMITVLFPVVGLNLHGLVSVRYFTLERAELARLIGAMVQLGALMVGAALLILVLTGRWWAPSLGLGVHWVAFAVLATGLQSLAMINLALLQAQERAPIYAAVQVGTACTVAVVTVIGVLGWAGHWSARAWGHFAGFAGAAALSLVMLRRGQWLVMGWADFRRLACACLSFGLPLLPHSIGAIAMASAGQLLIARGLGAKEVAFYALGLQFGAAFGLLADAFVKSYGPWLYRKLSEGAAADKRQVVKGIYAAFIVFPLLAFAFWLALQLAFEWVVGPGFDRAKGLLAYFCAAGGLLGMYYAVANLYFFSNQTGKLAGITLSSGALSLGAMGVLGRAWGLDGFACGYVLGQASLFLLAWVVSWKVYPLPWLETFRQHALRKR